MRYYSRTQSYHRLLGSDYPIVKLLMLINVAVFMLQWLSALFLGYDLLGEELALSPDIWKGHVWQVVTYMFLHSVRDPFHLIFNMLALWMFGKELEMVWGSRPFLKYYLICGIGAGLTFLLFSKGLVIGASGAVFGILLAFGMTFPDQIILMSFLFPIKAKYMVLLYGVITFLNIAKPSGDNVAHYAHLGGMVVGFLYLKRDWFVARLTRPTRSANGSSSSQNRPPVQERSSRERVDEILDKINQVGYDRLTQEEKDILLRASRNYSDPPRS